MIKPIKKFADRLGLTSIPLLVNGYISLKKLFRKNDTTPVYKGKESSSNWIRCLYWNGSDWEGYSSHDWRYSIELQEGALYFAIELNNNSLDYEIKNEFDYIHKNINKDGTIVGLSDTCEYEYGLILSSLALGVLRFNKINPVLSNKLYQDMKKVYNYIKSQWEIPNNLSDYSLILRGLANTYKVFSLKNKNELTPLKALIKKYVEIFKNNQDKDGFWDLGSSTLVQAQLKRNIAILLAYDTTLNPSYLEAVKNNVEWILKNRWDNSTGCVKWGSTDYFFECHQMWFMIVLKYLYDKSNGRLNYALELKKAWTFLTDNNYANIDLYLHNYKNNGAFFSYREIDSRGNIQSHYNFKGTYETGSALWGMALNYELVKKHKSIHSDKPHNYLLKQIEQIKKPPEKNGFFTKKDLVRYPRKKVKC